MKTQSGFVGDLCVQKKYTKVNYRTNKIRIENDNFTMKKNKPFPTAKYVLRFEQDRDQESNSCNRRVKFNYSFVLYLGHTKIELFHVI